MALSLVTGVAAVLVAAIGAINGSEVTAAAVALLALAITSGAAAALTFLSAARMAEAARASALDGARTQLTELSEAVSIASQRLTAVVSEQDAAHRASDAELRNLTTEVAGLRGVQAAAAETIGARLDAMGRHLKDRLGSAHWHRENLYRQTEDLLALYAQLTPRGSLPPPRGAPAADVGPSPESLFFQRPQVLISHSTQFPLSYRSSEPSTGAPSISALSIATSRLSSSNSRRLCSRKRTVSCALWRMPLGVSM